ncbi:MAG: hypothetical protein AB8G96_07265, partial [Phycisphaerales bacterium]
HWRGLSLLGMTTVAGIGSAVSGQSYEYRVVRLEPELTSTPFHNTGVLLPDSINEQRANGVFFDTDSSIALGINENGAVTGAAYVPSADGMIDPAAMRAFVWQPRAGIPGVGVETLHHVPFWSTDEFHYSIGTDINDEGDICGYAVTPGVVAGPAEGGFNDRAFFTALRPGAGSLSLNTMHLLQDAQGFRTAAHGLSDRFAGSLRVVGRGGDPANPCAIIGDNGVIWSPTFSLTATVLDTDMYAVNTNRSSAWGINPGAAAPTETEYISGYNGTCLSEDLTCNGFTDLLPKPWVDGELWGSDLNDGTLQWEEGQARDVNDSGVFAGYVRRLDVICLERASTWTWDPVTQQADLALLPVSSINPLNETTATATNGLGAVVGADLTAQAAMLWENGVSTELNDIVAIPTSGVINLEFATDVNRSGWITATARLAADAGVTTIGVVLVPVGDCPEDVDQDGDVDADDLAIVQAAASTGTGCNNVRRIPWEDVNADCVVNQNDVKLVLKAMTRATCQQVTLNSALAELWLSAGGAEYLDADPEAASMSVEQSYSAEGELDTFLNLVNLLGAQE